VLVSFQSGIVLVWDWVPEVSVSNHCYRGYFLSGGEIVDVAVIDCSDDREALVEADRVLSASGYTSMEVWYGARKVSTLTRRVSVQ
jgi:hypothetical protein